MKTENAIKDKEKMNITELINNYTENEELRAALNEYAKEKPLDYLRFNLGTLNKLTNDENKKIAIVKRSLENGWRGFYKLYEAANL